DRIGYAELETIYRQREQWMRDASLDLARGNVGKAVEAYRANGRMIGAELKAEAVRNLIVDWNRDYDPTKTTLILAHLRRDVRMLNEMARSKLVERGIVGEGFAFRTADGNRNFAAGDQIVFLKNEGSLGVKNGMLGKIVEASPNRVVAEIGAGEHHRQVIIEQRFYNNLDHGYATTIHKSQGATVDRVKVLASLSLDRHLVYVAMTRHRDNLDVYYGARSFARAGGLIQVLSRKNSKETTLDYEKATFYRQALRFAEARGLHLLNVARTIARDRLAWTARQSSRLADLAHRLVRIGRKLGLAAGTNPINSQRSKETRPMVAGIATHPESVEQAVADKLAADPGLKTQWDDVSTRFHLVYAHPAAAFKAVNIDVMLKDETAAKATLSKIAKQPDSYGALKGKTGLLASRADRQDRERAVRNVPALVQSLDGYMRQRGSAERRYRAEELEARRKVAIDIPALSPGARQILERVRDAIDRNDLSAALEFARADRHV
ncbi:BID domain-containing protein, partial [Sinorhizobium medicae]